MSFLSVSLNSLLVSQQTLSHCVVCVSKFSESCIKVNGNWVAESNRELMSPAVDYL